MYAMSVYVLPTATCSPEHQLTEATLLSGSPAGLYSPFQLRQ
jgi:hypothetical protein